MTRSGAVPTTISEEPPPTSTTPSSPLGTCPSVRAAPRKASLASSSPDRTSIGRSQARRIASASAPPLRAWRIAAVATAMTSIAPSSRARRNWARTTSTTSPILASGSVPSRGTPRPMRVKARAWCTSTRRSPSHSATSSRVVFEPMSMQARRTAGQPTAWLRWRESPISRWRAFRPAASTPRQRRSGHPPRQASARRAFRPAR